MRLPEHYTRQEIAKAVRGVIKTFGGEAFLVRAIAEIEEVNRYDPINGKTTILKPRLCHVYKGNGNFGADYSKLAKRWLLKKYPWAFLEPLDSAHINKIQRFFGTNQNDIVEYKNLLKGTFTAIRDHSPKHPSEFLLSKFSFTPNVSTGTIEVREEFTTKLKGREGEAHYSWEGVCFPAGRFIYVMMRENLGNGQPMHIKFMVLLPNRGHKMSIHELCGHYLLGLNGIEHVRHTNIFMIRDQLSKECYINPVKPELLDEDLTRRMKDAIKRIASFET